MNRLLLTLGFVACFTLGTVLDPRFRDIQEGADTTGGFLAALLGDSRRMFASQFFAKADEYFHSGYYPTIFDSAKPDADVNGEPDHTAPKKESENEPGFLGPPKDWIEAFGRHFIPTVHTHLDDARAREILPWLRLSADMDPHRLQTYLTASYWLRTSINKPDEAMRFLLEGLRANPDSYEILLEMSRVRLDNQNNPRAARNDLVAAAAKWKKQEAAGRDPNPKTYEEILGGFVLCDEKENNLQQKLVDLEALKAVSPNKASVERTIEETRAKLNGGAPAH